MDKNRLGYETQRDENGVLKGHNRKVEGSHTYSQSGGGKEIFPTTNNSL